MPTNGIWDTSVLTKTINAMKSPTQRLFDRYFRPKLNFQASEILEIEIITGSEKLMKTININAPATVRDKTGRKIINMSPPRLSQKRSVLTGELVNLRAYGSAVQLEQMKARIAREMRDMRNECDRTLEFWASRCIKGKIYDSDLSTVLVDYNFDSDHNVTLTDLFWGDSDGNPVADIRTWKRLIEDDSTHPITHWHAFCGFNVMNTLLKNSYVQELIKYQKGVEVLDTGRIASLVGVEIEEYNGSFIDDSGTRQRFIDEDEFILIGEGEDVFDCPYAAIADDECPSGIGNVDINGKGMLFFSNSWPIRDPSGRWIKIETRPLPVLRRPSAIVVAAPLAS